MTDWLIYWLIKKYTGIRMAPFVDRFSARAKVRKFNSRDVGKTQYCVGQANRITTLPRCEQRNHQVWEKVRGRGVRYAIKFERSIHSRLFYVKLNIRLYGEKRVTAVKREGFENRRWQKVDCSQYAAEEGKARKVFTVTHHFVVNIRRLAKRSMQCKMEFV